MSKINIDRILTPNNKLYITKNRDDKIIHGVLNSAGIQMTRTSRPIYSVTENIHLKIEVSIPTEE